MTEKIMPMDIIIHPETAELSEGYRLLKEELAKLIEEQASIRERTIPYIEAQYMKFIGTYKHELMTLEYLVMEHKRRLSLVQAYINRNEKINLQAIDKTIKEEFQKWQREIEQYRQKLQEAKQAEFVKITPELNKELKTLYRELVKRLHPDINPNTTEDEKILWQRVSQAYSIFDIEELKSLLIIINSKDITDKANTIEQLKQKKEKLIEAIKHQNTKITELWTGFPLCLAEKLEDKDWIEQETASIKSKITETKIELRFYAETIMELTGQSGYKPTSH